MVVMVAHNFETNIISSAIGGQDSVMYYEGCGHEGPVRCIFFCEFHPVVGPKITCQVIFHTFLPNQCEVYTTKLIVNCAQNWL